MSNLVITTESPADINKEVAKELGIGVIPLHVSLDGKDYADGVDIDNALIMQTFQEKKILPNTSAISIAEYADFFQKYLDEGKTIIHIALSSGISSTYQNACIAASDLDAEDRLFIVDSKSLSHGNGYLVYKAADMAANGSSVEEILDALQAMIPKVHKAFMITSLEFMRHGGRCSMVEALGANLLKLKPCIDLVDGKMEVTKKYRGADLKAYQDYFAEALGAGDYDKSLVCFGGVEIPADTLKTLETLLKKQYGFEKIIQNSVGSVIAAHGGKGALILNFLRK